MQQKRNAVQTKGKLMTKKKAVNKKTQRKRKRKKSKLKFKHILIIGCVIYVFSAVYGAMKPLPAGISKAYEPSKTNDVKLLIDKTYEKNNKMYYEHEIFNEQLKTIKAADDFIILDMFLFNDTYDGDVKFPKLTTELTHALINKKKENPDIQIYMLTDPINSFYGSYTPAHYKMLRDNGISVYETNLVKLRDSNPIYSGLWRPTLRFFGNNENGLIPNIFSKEAPNVTVRGFARLLNMKANHRKTLVTEDAAIISSSNPHDPSGHHQNVAVKVTGQLQEDLIKSEVHALNMSGSNLSASDFAIKNRAYSNDMDYKTALVTEGKVKEAILRNINSMKSGDNIKMGMFYLSDRDIVKSLLNASERGVEVRIILDVNKEAFGKEKPGIPNKPVAHELVSKSDDHIKVRWAVSHGEQFHAKYTLFRSLSTGESTVILGSANLTRRNVGDYNMETDVVISGKSDLSVFKQLNDTFDAMWENKYAHVTDDYDVQKDPSFIKDVLYRVQEFTGLSSF
ncbi:phospholipase D family protein [Macrococcus armenti]|uniref:phospholipase D family protein n=1 Tax=Macrococcus armenti TaxID=2875764 RepID=UPI001CC9EF57|nr:phospholipase D family protein [Macrococcus armenti]UBH09082.1 phospholipase D family protein [Macrococcus armenti]UBH11376.1 phospholipase D family protein [Macrococcus armenti]